MCFPSLKSLEFRSELKLDIPSEIEHWLNQDKIHELIISKQKELEGKYKLYGFHSDFGMIDSVLSAVLQIVDDNNCGNKRRFNILNPDFKYVGISHITNGKRFCSYSFFAG